ncbi:L-idonate 5-dehydrogenase [Aestuariivirga litoralis]|uniref:L-idonate 5-dehydrogenase n=1 Tax=Aestuariivirga litoralis TaxID=2650924 RepID=UPI0018C5E605|nr:L-idonate 5-dehydrogenase [Aestuariivirga litoralis]MBG1233285.1 L-idonate 5-dehydrogenase [Aestuariivirga litoralis]
MKAIVIHAPKDLRIEERDVEEPGPGQVQVKLAAGGICGSDLHYYNHGGFGTVKLKEPMILGHEVAGHITKLGDGVQGLAIGQLVAVSPSRPCYQCKYCREGMHNQCLNMRFYGSAMPFPHIQGAFREVLVADTTQCVVADGLTAGEAAMAEPLSVTLHATRRAGELLGKSVLVTGCGPIGLLSIICARRAGADLIVATDLTDFTLGMAKQLGADVTLNTAEAPDALEKYKADKGAFDVLYECSGAQRALVSAISVMRPGGTLMQLGMSGDMTLPMMQVTAKELSLKGTFRFHSEYKTAVSLMQKGLIDVKPLITHRVRLDDALSGFNLANDRAQAMKVQIAFA